MTISKVKLELLEHLDSNVLIKYDLGRNKYEEFEAKIKELYDYVFIVESSLGIKSFAYIDVITKSVKIDYLT